MSDLILFDAPAAGVQRITLNRPEAGNAFTHEMYDRLLAIFEQLRDDLSVRAVILTGAGRAFCTGHDLRAAGALPDEARGLSGFYAQKQFLARLSRIPLAMRALPQPVIGAINGSVAGIGFALSLCCDITLAGGSAKFVNAIHNAGTGHELGLSYLLPRQIGAQRAAELLLTARPVLAEEAERIGLVVRSVADEQLADAALELAQAIAANVPIGVMMTKQSLWLNQGAGSLEAAIEMEHRAVHIAQATEDAAEKRAAFFEKRPPDFRFA
jgi:enoyl-CoA hydratase